MGLSDQLQFVGPLAVGFVAVPGAGAAITFYGLEQVPGDKGPPLVWLVLQTGVSIFIGAMGAQKSEMSGSGGRRIMTLTP